MNGIHQCRLMSNDDNSYRVISPISTEEWGSKIPSSVALSRQQGLNHVERLRRGLQVQMPNAHCPGDVSDKSNVQRGTNVWAVLEN